MLNLTRSANPGRNEIHLPGIRIIVTEVRGGQVRLAIDAPRDVPVHKGERSPATASASSDRENPSTIAAVASACQSQASQLAESPS